MNKKQEGLFPELDYKKLKVIDPERKARFPEIKLFHFLVVITILATAVAFYSQSTRQKRVPPPTARDFHIPPPGMERPKVETYEQQRGQRGFSLSY